MSGYKKCKNCGKGIHQVPGFRGEKWVHDASGDYDCHLGAKP